jgi:light-regulated signal transduction histidine kinase (bacteriophytochrome)
MAQTDLQSAAAERTRSTTELQQLAYIAPLDLQEPLRTIQSYTRSLARRYEGKPGVRADGFIEFAVEGQSECSFWPAICLRSRVKQLNFVLNASCLAMRERRNDHRKGS